MITKQVTGDTVKKLLKEPVFLQSWGDIYSRCNWATLLQHPDYVTSWYDHYSDEYDPIILTHETKDQELVGLLFLAINKSADQLIMAGHPQFEYQTWIANSTNYLYSFIQETLDLLSEHYVNYDLEMTYLPSSFPIDELEEVIHKQNISNVFIERHDKPVIEIDKEAIEKSLRSKSKKSKINRMKRMGELSFRKVNSVKEFNQWFDQIIDCYDFRQRATHDSSPFFLDPKKRPHHIDLFKRGMLHVTLMSINEKLVSTMIGVVSGDELSNAIITHSPFFAKQSPGEIHIKWLALLLADEGINKLDLTPGDNWKLRHANKIDTAYRLLIFASKKRKLIQFLKYNLKNFVLSVYPDLKKKVFAYRAKKLKSLAEQQSIAAKKRIEALDLSRISVANNENSSSDFKTPSKNNLHELLYAVNSDGIRDDFFWNALSELEKGNNIYMVRAGNKIAAYCILDKSNEKLKILDFYAESSIPHYGFLEKSFSLNTI